MNRRRRASVAADIALAIGAVAVLVGVLTARETFAAEVSSVRLAPGEGHGWQPLVLAATAIGIAAAQRLMPGELRRLIRGSSSASPGSHSCTASESCNSSADQAGQAPGSSSRSWERRPS